MKTKVRCRLSTGLLTKATGFLLAFFMVFLGKVEATHLAGAEITYVHQGGNTYQINMKVYRDCRGVALGGGSQSVRIVAPNGSTSIISLAKVSFSDITPTCPGQTSPCNPPDTYNPGGPLGYEEHIYRANNVTINPVLGGGFHTLWWSLCCRNNAITTLSNPGNQTMAVRTLLDAAVSPRNSSPTFLNPPLAIVCAGQPTSLSPNASDPDGDFLEYSLSTCQQSLTQNVNYAAGRNATNPLATVSGTTIDQFNGEMNFTASGPQVGVICTRVEEFRNIGGVRTKIGEINRDIQVNVIACNNNNPVIASISNQIATVGNTLCVPVSATDANNDNITLTATSSVGTFTLGTSGAGFANGTFCFTPTLAQQGLTFTVTINAQDDACPSPGSDVETFNITVPAVQCSLAISASAQDASCNQSDGSASVSQSGGVSPISYNWSNGATTSSISGLAPGTYGVTVIDGFNCVETASVTVGGGSTNIAASVSSSNPSCPNTNDGSITVSTTGGVAPVSYSLNGGTAQSSGTFSGLGVGSYTITVTDASGCPGIDVTATLTAVDNTAPVISCPMDITVSNEPGQCGAVVNYNVSATDNCPGSVSVTQNSGLGSGAFFPVGSSNESFTATDAFGNSASCSFRVTVEDNEAPVATCPSNITVDNDPGVCGAAVSFSASASDNCPGVSLAQTSGQASGSTFAVGTSSVSYTATDAAGNTGSCSFTVTVNDAEAPSITCPADLSLECLRDIPAPNTAGVSASDNCGVASVAHDGDTDNGGSGCAGDPLVISRTYTATDVHGNSSSCTQTISVESTPVVAVASPNAIVFVNFPDSSCTTISVAAMGGCPGYTYQWSNGATTASQQVCPTQTTVYTVTVTDAEGCTGVDDVKVCVIDAACTSRTNNGVGGTGQGGNGTNNSPNAMVHITMCHIPPGNPANAMTKCLPIPAAQAHFAVGHGGDYLGACGSLASRTCDANTQKTATSGQAVSLDGRIDAFPNPFERATNIVVNFDEATYGAITVYNLQGEVVAELYNGSIANSVTVEFDGSTFANGIYVVRVVTENGFVMHKKLTLQK